MYKYCVLQSNLFNVKTVIKKDEKKINKNKNFRS